MIVVESKKKKIENIKKQYPDCIIIDVTSKAQDEFVRLSPFYPVGGIPVPFTEGMRSVSVEGIWQGLKCFDKDGRKEGVDLSCFRNNTMKNLKRTVRTHGRCLGHRKGVYNTELLGYIDARREIYLPSYRWMLENKGQEQVKKIRIIAQSRTVVLLDYETNSDPYDPSKPLSHASLIKAFIEGNYPE